MTEASGPAMKQSQAPPGAGGFPKRFGKYTLLRPLATGGMAELYLALQKSVAGFEKLIVIKRILPSMNSDPAFIDMLLHEARIAATLSHPNVVQIFDVGFAEGAFYIAMEHTTSDGEPKILRECTYPLTAVRVADDAEGVPPLDGVGVVTPPKSLRKFAVQLSWFSVAYVVHVVSTSRVRT